MQHTILQGEPSDAPQIASVIAKSYSETFGPYLTPDELQGYVTSKLSPEYVEKQIRDPINTYFIAANVPTHSVGKEAAGADEIDDQNESTRKGKEVLGVLELRDKTPHKSINGTKVLCVNRLYMSSEAQGKGIASDLVSRAEEDAKRRGYDSLWLIVWKNGQRAKRFYEKQGFVFTGEEIRGELGGTELVMQKIL